MSLIDGVGSSQGVVDDSRLGSQRVDRKQLRVDRNAHQRKVYEARKLAGLCTRCGETADEGSQYCAAHGGHLREQQNKALAAIRKRRRKQGRCRYCRRKSKTSRCQICLAREGGLPRSSMPRLGNQRVDQTRVDVVVEADGYARKRFVGQRRRGAPSRASEDAASKRHADKAWEQWQLACARATDMSNGLHERDRKELLQIAHNWLNQAVGHAADRLRRNGYDTTYVDDTDVDE